jgi:hypothetical protein
MLPLQIAHTCGRCTKLLRGVETRLIGRSPATAHWQKVVLVLLVLSESLNSLFYADNRHGGHQVNKMARESSTSRLTFEHLAQPSSGQNSATAQGL